MNQEKNTLKRELGLFAAITIVVGNMIGSGIFGLPSALAQIASPTIIILAWIVAAVGAITIALSYGNLSKSIPEAGGPVVYSEVAMGKFGGYSVSLIWWIGSAVGNAAIVDLIFTQFVQFIPSLNIPIYKLIVTIAFLWCFTYINIIGVKMAGWISIITTILKVSVFLIIILLALPYLNVDVFSDQQAIYPKSNKSDFSMFTAAMALIFWAFTGLESSTMAGGEIKNPKRNIQLSVIWGLSIVGIIYVLINLSLFALMSQTQLALSTSPFADAINLATGTNWGGKFVDAAILISVMGALSGWILTTGRSVYAASKDGFFVKSFSKVHTKYSTPHIALIASSLITSIFLFLNFYSDISNNNTGISPFINITTIAAFINLPTYLFTILSEFILIKKGKIQPTRFAFTRIFFAFIFAIIFIYFGAIGSVVPIVYWIIASTLLVIGLGFYPFFNRSK